MDRTEYVKLKSVWYAMWARCTKETHPQWKDYGGRGIKVTDSWKDFQQFLTDMGERPKGYTLERLDNTQGYFKENCIWASWEEQSLNKRKRSDNTTGITGVAYSSRDGAYVASIKVNSRSYHLYQGPSIEAAVAARKTAEQLFRGAP